MKKQTNSHEEAHLEAQGILKKRDAMKSKKYLLVGKNIFTFPQKIIEWAAIFLVCTKEYKTLLNYSSLPTNSQPYTVYIFTD